MATPAIQTLITDAQQVLNLKSLSEIRATLTAVLANANIGTPLNPNLTTQQLWDEFYEIVRQTPTDIESILVNQMMKFVFSPPAPGGVGANHEVIYNNNGVLAGDSKFLWDDALNKLDIDGSATITGDLTVDTNTLFVDAANDRVGMGTLTPVARLIVRDGANRNLLVASDASHLGSAGIAIGSFTDNAADWAPLSLVAKTSIAFGLNGSTAMTLNSTGLGVGATPSNYRLYVSAAFASGLNGAYIECGEFNKKSLVVNHTNVGVSANLFEVQKTGTALMTLDASGNLLVGRTSVAGAERLCVEKDQAANEIVRFRSTNATDPYGLAIQYTANISTSGNDFAAYYVNATTIRFGFRSNGGMANYQANNVNLSDSRTKTNIKPLASYWNKIKALELVTFKYNDQSHSDDNIGLIAQQVESVAPEFVDVDGFGKTPEDGVPLKTIYTTDLYHASIKALQEAMARIEVLETKLA